MQKQHTEPNENILQTRHLSDGGNGRSLGHTKMERKENTIRDIKLC